MRQGGGRYYKSHPRNQEAQTGGVEPPCHGERSRTRVIAPVAHAVLMELVNNRIIVVLPKEHIGSQHRHDGAEPEKSDEGNDGKGQGH